MATLLYHWKLDECTGQYAYDEVSNTSAKLYNSTAGDRGVAWTQNGYNGCGLIGDGTSGADTGALVSGTLTTLPRDFSLTLWCNTTVSQAAGILSLCSDEVTYSDSMAIQMIRRGATKPRIEFETIVSEGTYANVPEYISDATDTAYNDGQWHFVCVTSSSTGPVTKIYIDDCETAAEIAQQPFQKNLTYRWRIAGGGCFSVRPGAAFNGVVDDVRIFDGVLTPEEVCAVKLDFVQTVTNALMFSCNT